MAASRHKSPAGGRAVRVSEQVHHELAELIRTDVKDPGLGMVTVTAVEMTADYAHATVHYTVLPSDETTLAKTAAALKRAAGYLRIRLGQNVRIHTTPELHFQYDRSTEHGIEMSRLIDQANAQRGQE